MPGPTASGVSFSVAPYKHLKIRARTLAKIAQKGENAARSTPKSVAIKTTLDSLVSITYGPF
jgi:hypothetical protein